MSTSSSVPAWVLSHRAFQAALEICPIGPEMLYQEFLSQTHGSQESLKDLLDNFFERRAAIPKIGLGLGPKRKISLDYGVRLTLTYIPINTLPQYLVEMVVKPVDHVVFVAPDPAPIHGIMGGSNPEEKLGAVNGIYYMAVNQGFFVRSAAGTTPRFAIPGPPSD